MINERPHKKLEVWKESIKLVTLIYDVTKQFPKEEEFGLKSQLRKAAVSVLSNIAEGLTRSTNPDRIHFLNIANGSLSEIDTQLEIASRLQFISSDQFGLIENTLVIVQKLISGLIRKIRLSK